MADPRIRRHDPAHGEPPQTCEPAKWRDGRFASRHSTAVFSRSHRNPEAPQDAFSRQRGIYRSDVAPNCRQIPGREPNHLPPVGPEPRQRTCREEHDPLIVRDEFRTGYSLIGLLASSARLRFTGIVRISLDGES
jgi:hypothetical protein